MRIFNCIITLFFGIALLGMMSCSGDPVDKAIKIIDKATQEVEKAKSMDEAQEITIETGTKLEKLDLKSKNLTPEDQKRLAEALAKYMQAAMKVRANDVPVEVPTTVGEEFVSAGDSLATP